MKGTSYTAGFAGRAGRRPLRALSSAVGLALACSLAAVTVPGLASPARAASPEITGAHLAALLGYMDRHPDDFAGYTLDPATHTATIRMMRPAAGLPETADTDPATDYDQSPDLAGNWSVATVAGRASTSQLQDVATSIPTTEPFATEAANGHLTSWGVDPATDQVTVGLSTVDPGVESSSRSAFGDLVAVHQEDRPTRAGRGNDGTPFWAGDRIFINKAQCTNAFRITKGGYHYMLTAGHCATTDGWTVWTGPTWSTANTVLGYLDYRIRSASGWDSGLIGGESYGMYVWISGDLTNSSSSLIGGHANPVTNEYVCTSGSTTFRNCNYITNGGTSDCVTFTDGVTTCHLTTARAINGATTVCGGDSGGPVITSTSPTTAIGVIIGAGPICSAGGRMYYHAIGPLLSYWGASFG